MKELSDKIKIFYDGIHIQKYGALPFIHGFTTNTSIMKAGGITNYRAFLDEHRSFLDGRPISMQVFEDEDAKACLQAEQIASLGDQVYVKIPIVKSTGQSNSHVIQQVLQNGIKINITTVFTKDQIDTIYDHVKDARTGVIVSIFAGRISDTCRDPIPIIRYAVERYAALPHVEVLWAGCKETLSIQHAIGCGCHIITVPETILDRIQRYGKDLHESSIETSASFRKDALLGGLQIL